jgi:AcrR family transcriptional regulator
MTSGKIEASPSSKDNRDSMEEQTSRSETRTAAKAAPSGRRRRQSRIEKSEMTRERLFAAASEVIGEVGYADAAISEITKRAGIAQGTFYNYFESRQDLLDQVLPAMGDRMLAHIRQAALGGRSFSELERKSFLGFFSFLKEAPPFFRILNDAESFAPRAYRQHIDKVARRYLRFLRRSWRAGEFPAYSESELEVIVYILMAARSYIAWRYVGHEGKGGQIPQWVVETYLKFVSYGLQGAPATTRRSAPRRTAAPKSEKTR